jgi:hypothetical protein
VNTLYSEHSDIYDIIADDRDFEKECQWICKSYQSLLGVAPKSIIELFAGPAYHSNIFRTQHHCKVVAIDNSQTMKKQALLSHRVLEDEYIVGALPKVLQSFPSNQGFDVCVIPRYSIGLIDYYEAEILFSLLAEILNVNGLVFIELHKVELLVAQFDHLDIKSRTRVDKEKNIIVNCEWPSGPLAWDKESWKVLMPITIKIDGPNGRFTYETTSEERIYRCDEIMRLAAPF